MENTISRGVGSLSKKEPTSSTASNTSRQTKPRRILIFVVLSLVVLTQALDATCICVTLPVIASELNATASGTLSLGTAFLLATTLSQPIFTELACVVGRKLAYLVALGFFIVGTIVCGRAESIVVLLVGRAIQGIGAGGPQPLAAFILNDLFPLRERARWVSFLNISWALGSVLGPLLGGFFTQNESIGWRWLFWVNMPPLGTSFVGAWWLLGYDKPSGPFSLRLLVRVDWIGLILFVLAGTAVLTPLSWVGSRYPWKSLAVIVPLATGLIGFIVLGWYETKIASRALFRPSMFRNLSTIFQFVNMVLHGALMWMTLYYMSLYYLGVKGLSPLMTGVWALPATLTVAPMAIMVGQVASRTGHYRTFLLGGWVSVVPIYFLMTLIKADTRDRDLVLISLFLGLAFGTLVPAMSIGVQATVTQDDTGYAVAMMYILRAGGQTVGIALGQGIFSSRLDHLLKEQGWGEDAAQNLIQTMRNSAAPEGRIGRQQVDAVVDALRALWWTGGALASAGLILAICTRCPRLPEDGESGAQRATGVEPEPEPRRLRPDMEARD